MNTAEGTKKQGEWVHGKRQRWISGIDQSSPATKRQWNIWTTFNTYCYWQWTIY